MGKEHFAISNKYRSPLNNAWVRGLITPQPLTSLSTFSCPAVGNPCLAFNSAVIPSHTQSHTRWMENNIFHPHWENPEVLFSICGCLNLLMQNSWLWRTDYIFWKTSSVSGPVKFKPMLLKSQLYKVSLVRGHLIANSKMLYNIRFIALQTTKTGPPSPDLQQAALWKADAGQHQEETLPRAAKLTRVVAKPQCSMQKLSVMALHSMQARVRDSNYLLNEWAHEQTSDQPQKSEFCLGSVSQGGWLLFGRLRKCFTHQFLPANFQGDCDNAIQIKNATEFMVVFCYLYFSYGHK